MKKKVELLAPAGNMECLKTALYFGADAVYLAGKQYGLRAFAANFTQEELGEAVRLAHSLKKRVYLTLNALFRNQDFEGFPDYLLRIKEMGIDAVIVSDPGVMQCCLEAGLEVHLSTQASTLNAQSAAFWHRQGVKRIVLAREITLAEAAEIAQNAPDGLELEAFIHGAMCIAYSGRCLLSSVLTGRSGNKGECAQPCRWRYTIHEAGYPEEYFPIGEDENGAYLLNSKDLMMIEHLPALIESGIASFKIEGRMKSAYYVGCVVGAYRKAIDAYLADPEHYALDQALVQELYDSATRRFTTGFYFGNPSGEGQDISRSPVPRRYGFCGIALESSREDGLVLIEQRNKFSVGDTIDILSPNLPPTQFTLEKIWDEQMQEQPAAPHPQQRIYIVCPVPLAKGDLLRRKLD
ncbi:U32 family peptidase [Christensenellaceae bacterium 44-20]